MPSGQPAAYYMAYSIHIQSIHMYILLSRHIAIYTTCTVFLYLPLYLQPGPCRIFRPYKYARTLYSAEKIPRPIYAIYYQ